MTNSELSQAENAINDFQENEPAQQYIADAINLLADLCAAASAAKGFTENELVLRDALRTAFIADTIKQEDLEWFESCVEQAEIARMQSELGEAIEGIRKPHPDTHCPQYDNKDVEYADTIIRVADTCGRREIRIGQVIVDKLLANLARPKKHGKNS